MKITIESTDKMIEIRNGRSGHFCQGRLWEGKTESGIPIQCVIIRVATPGQENQEQFVKELRECRPPEQEQAFSLRLVI